VALFFAELNTVFALRHDHITPAIACRLALQARIIGLDWVPTSLLSILTGAGFTFILNTL
jgi:hypothetical protein